jgi:hypothetical protein
VCVFVSELYGVYVSTFINHSTSKKLFRQSPKTETYFFLKPLILSAIFHIDNILSHDKLKKHLEKREVFRYNSNIAFCVTTYSFLTNSVT